MRDAEWARRADDRTRATCERWWRSADRSKGTFGGAHNNDEVAATADPPVQPSLPLAFAAPAAQAVGMAGALPDMIVCAAMASPTIGFKRRRRSSPLNRV